MHIHLVRPNLFQYVYLYFFFFLNLPFSSTCQNENYVNGKKHFSDFRRYHVVNDARSDAIDLEQSMFFSSFLFFRNGHQNEQKMNKFELNYLERTSSKPNNCDATIQYHLSLDYNKLIDVCCECDRMAANQSADKQNTKYYLFVLWTNHCHVRKFERPNIIFWSIEWIHSRQNDLTILLQRSPCHHRRHHHRSITSEYSNSKQYWSFLCIPSHIYAFMFCRQLYPLKNVCDDIFRITEQTMNLIILFIDADKYFESIVW